MTKRTPLSEFHGSLKIHVRLTVSCFLMLMLICLFATSVQAQVLYGSLTGSVTDSSGAAVAGVKVDALNTGTGITRPTTTGDSGVYALQALQAGTYRVSTNPWPPQFTESRFLIQEGTEELAGFLDHKGSSLERRC